MQSTIAVHTPPQRLPHPHAHRLLRRVGQTPHPLPILGSRARRSRRRPLSRHTRLPHHRQKPSPQPTPTSSSSPGAEQGIASPSNASSTNATGITSKPSANRRVFCIPDQYLNTPAHTLLEGLACIAAATHPTLHPPHPELIQLSETQLTEAEASSDPDPSPASASSAK